jgi:hypothetical protein
MAFKSLKIFTKTSQFKQKPPPLWKWIKKIFQNVPHYCKNLHLSGNNLKKPQIPWKSLTSLQKILNSIDNVFKKPRYPRKSHRLLIEAFICLKNSFLKPRNLYKSLTFSLKMSLYNLKNIQNASLYWKTFHFFLNVIKKPRNFWKATHQFKNASIPQKMYLKNLAIFENHSH